MFSWFFVTVKLAIYWFRVAAVQVGPCILLLFLNGRLMIELKVAFQRRQQLRLYRNRTEVRTTLMLVIIVCVFLLVELPSAVLIGVSTFGPELPKSTAAVAVSLINFVGLLSYPLYILIFAFMSDTFRKVLLQKFLCLSCYCCASANKAPELQLQIVAHHNSNNRKSNEQ